MRRPNVVLIWTDQQRWDTLGAGGFALMSTPNTNRLARSGRLFINAYANCPVCMPSRQSVLSGRYPSSLGTQSNGVEMPAGIDCIHNILSAHGYHTAQLGKLHFLNHASYARDHRDPHPAYGFDTCIVSDEPGCYDDPYISWVRHQDPAAVPLCRVDTPPAWRGAPVSVHPRRPHQPYTFAGPEELTHSAFVADLTCDYIRSRASRAREGEPFMAIAGFYAPHAPLNPPARYLTRYDPEMMPLPFRREGENFTDPETGTEVSDAQWRIIKQHYYALISHVDECVGRILDTLDQCGLTEDTLIIYTSDHGENLGDHGLVGKSHWYDSSTRVPLVVKPPASPETNTDFCDDRLVELVDIAPTIAEFCGIPVPPAFQGRSLAGTMGEHGDDGRAEPGRQSVLIEHGYPGGEGFKAVRTSHYLYVRDRRGQERLYDHEDDPHQVDDLLASADSAGGGRTRELLAEARGELLHRIMGAEPPFPRPTAAY